LELDEYNASINMPTVEELQWAAGQFDGDGCVGAYARLDKTPNASEYLVLTVGKGRKGMASLVELHRLFGGRVCKARDAKDPSRQDVVHWTIEGEAAKQACVAMAPYSQLK